MLRHLLALCLLLGAVLAATGCTAFDIAKGRVGDRIESIVTAYCDQPASVRAVVRVETNAAVAERATIVIACKGEPGYEELRRLYVDPLSESTFQAIINRLLTEGAITLPDGTRLRVVVDEPRE